MKTQKETSKPLLQVKPPETPCDACIEECGKIFADELVFVYCYHNSSGAILDIATQRWHIFCPISPEEFESILNYNLAFARLLRKVQIEKELAGKPVFH